MPCRCHRLAALITRPCFAHIHSHVFCSRIFPVKHVPAPIFLPSSFVRSPKRLCSNRRTYTLHRSLLQGHILPSRRPRHPRPALLVLQVLVFQHVIVWVEGLGVLGLPTPLSYALPCGFVLHITRPNQNKTKKPPFPPPLTILPHLLTRILL